MALGNMGNNSGSLRKLIFAIKFDNFVYDQKRKPFHPAQLAT